MKITYIAKRSQGGKFICYDIVADGICFNLFLSDKASIENIASSVAEWLALRPNAQQAAQSYAQGVLRESDSIEVMKGSLDAKGLDEPEETPSLPLEKQTLEEKPEGAIPVFPEGKPGMQWSVAQMQNYMVAYQISHGDDESKKVMLKKIKKHYNTPK